MDESGKKQNQQGGEIIDLSMEDQIPTMMDIQVQDSIVKNELKNELKNEIKNLDEKTQKNINVVCNPLVVDLDEKVTVLTIQPPEEKFEVDCKNQLKKLTGNSQKSKNIVSNLEIDLTKNEIKTQKTNLEIVSNDTDIVEVFDRDSNEEKKDVKVATLPSIMRMNVKMPLANLDVSNMSVQLVEEIPANFSRKITIPIEDSQHMIIDESKLNLTADESQQIPHDIRMDSTSRLTIPDLGISTQTMDTTGDSLKKSSSRITLSSERLAMEYASGKRNFASPKEELFFNTDSLINLDQLGDGTCQLDAEMQEDEYPQEEDGNPFAHSSPYDPDDHLDKWVEARTRLDEASERLVNTPPKLLGNKAVLNRSIGRVTQALMQCEHLMDQLQTTVAICNICRRKFNLMTGDVIPPEELQYNLQQKIVKENIVDSAPERKYELEDYEENMPCQALRPTSKSAKVRIEPEPTDRQTRSMTRNKSLNKAKDGRYLLH